MTRLLLICSYAVVVGCQSLPASIATRAASIEKYCVPAADRTVAALRAMGYDANTVDGEVDGAQEWHSWVEYRDGDGAIVLLDPFALHGLVEMSMDAQEAHYYRQCVFVVRRE